MTTDFDEIRRLIREGIYEFSIHAQRERLEEDLDVVEIENALSECALLEEYPEDPRGWSCLLLGYAGSKAVHIVLGWARSRDDRIPRVITVYIPLPPKWIDPRTRGGRV